MAEDPTPYDEAVSDFEAGFERLAKSYGDKDEQRRAWLETVNHTYRLREYRRQGYDKKAGKGAYYALVASHEFGKTTEGIIVVRNIATHVLAVRANPEPRMLYPSPKLYPIAATMQAKAGSHGTLGFVAQDTSEGAITYVDDSDARQFGLPVVKMLNAANYYVEPNAGSIAVALLKDKINPDLTSDLSQAYVNPDPRAYVLSSYSYMIVPKDTSSNFNTEKGRTLSDFASYLLCEGQQQAEPLGYSPLPINLVQAAVNQINQVPGSTHKLDPTNLAGCNNPTVSPTGGNLLVENAPQPSECDHKGYIRCTINPGENVSTTVTASPSSPVVAGTAVTLTANVTPSDVDGSVQFRDGSTNVGVPVSVVGGVASMTTTLPVGSHQLSASFTPAVSGVGFGATSQTLTYVVNSPSSPPSPPTPGPPTPTPTPPINGITHTATTLQVAPNSGFTFIPETLIARVSPFNVVGTVQFFDGSTALGGPSPVFRGVALTFVPLTKGTHTLTAVYSPTNCTTTAGVAGWPIPLPCPRAVGFAPSASSPILVVVNSLF